MHNLPGRKRPQKLKASQARAYAFLRKIFLSVACRRLKDWGKGHSLSTSSTSILKFLPGCEPRGPWPSPSVLYMCLTTSLFATFLQKDFFLKLQPSTGHSATNLLILHLPLLSCKKNMKIGASKGANRIKSIRGGNYRSDGRFPPEECLVKAFYPI